tara:strand:+ start:695 stop:1246 length:552 start_codon:yes stop_codon:yes gene_type:complete
MYFKRGVTAAKTVSILRAINDFRKTATGKAAAALVAAPLALGAATGLATEAHAGDGRIGHTVFKGKTDRQVAQMAHSVSSNGRYALVVHGGGDGLARFAYQIAKHYEDTTDFEVGLVEADDNNGNRLNAELHIYFDGAKRVVVEIRPAADGNQLGNAIIAEMNKVTVGDKRASAVTEPPTDPS